MGPILREWAAAGNALADEIETVRPGYDRDPRGLFVEDAEK